MHLHSRVDSVLSILTFGVEMKLLQGESLATRLRGEENEFSLSQKETLRREMSPREVRVCVCTYARGEDVTEREGVGGNRFTEVCGK